MTFRNTSVPLAAATAAIVVFFSVTAAGGGAPLDSIRLLAQDPFKPLRLFNVVVVGAMLFAGRRCRDDETQGSAPFGGMKRWFALVLAFLVIAAYLPSFAVNLWDHDWTHRHIGADLTSWRAFARLFTRPQVDGMYRPLAFFSFALDYQIFGLKLWGYHIQSVVVHLINTFLVWRLARVLGMSDETGWMAAVIFGLAAVHFEAVLWPAARFGLLACMFTLISLLCFVRWWKAEGSGRL